MEIKELLTTRNFTKMSNKQNKFIVIHYVGAVSTAKNNAVYFQNTYRGASASYFVDENEIWRIVKDSDAAWHCGTSGKYYSNARNSNSIGIEMCCYMNNGKLDIKESVVNRTIELTKELMKKYNIPASNVVRHYDVTRKVCPAPFVNDERRWIEFKKKLTEKKSEILIRTHVADKGWLPDVGLGEVAGTTGEARQMEAIILYSESISLEYRVHVADKGWLDWVRNGQIAGTTGEGRRIEAMEIKSSKPLKVSEHIQDVGWMPPSKGTEIHIGTQGKSLQMEALKIKLL